MDFLFLPGSVVGKDGGSFGFGEAGESVADLVASLVVDGGA